jgi:hypothetical protein
VREGKWKLLMGLDGAAPQLYDLEADPSESKNRATEDPKLVERLKRRLLEWNEGLPDPAAGPAAPDSNG